MEAAQLAQFNHSAPNALIALLLALCLAACAAIYPIIRAVRRARAIKEACDAALAGLESYRKALDQHFIIAETNRMGEIAYANDLFCKISQYSREELIGQTHRIVNSGQHDRAFFNRMWISIAFGGSWRGEICNKAKDGALYWVDTVIIPMNDAHGRLEKFISISSDITARKQTESALAQAHAALRSFIEHAPAAVAMFDRDMRYLAHTKRWLQDYGLGQRSLIGASHYDVFPNAPARWKDTYIRVLSGAVERCDEEELERGDGSRQVLRWEMRPWRAEDGAIGGVIMLTEDITERKAAEERLRASEERLRSLFSLAPVGVVLADLDSRRFVLASEAMLSMVGYTPEEFYRLTDDELTAPEFRRINADQMASVHKEGRFGPFEKEYLRKDGSHVPVLVNGVAVRDQDRKELSLMVVQDVTQRRAIEERLWRLANLDALTGLPNRMLFNERLKSAIRQAECAGAAFAVGLGDLDRFKDVNDTFGHDCGDGLLKAVAERLSQRLGPADTLARLGGDEFAFILMGADGVANILRQVQELFDAMAAPVTIAGAPRRCAMTMGVALYPTDAESGTGLLKCADIALYRAKALGRDRVEMYMPEMRAAIERSLQLRQDIDNALNNNAVCIVYQPVFTLPDCQIMGFEALLRIDHPTRGLLSPEYFEEVFEDPTRAAAITKRVTELVLSHAREWIGADLPFGKLFINVTSADVTLDCFADELLANLDAYGVSPRGICLEVTEGVLMGRASKKVISALAKLHATGIGVALDNFGSGFASLSDLKRFPISRLKIDRSLIAGMAGDPKDCALVRAVIDLGHSLGMKITAEGVETPAQLASLRSLGCDEAQGFLMGRPMPSSEVPGFVREAAYRRSNSRKLA